MLRTIKEQSAVDTPGVRTLCPTRWTVRADALASIISNYESLQELWPAAQKATSDTGMKARIQGISSQMQTFRFFFAINLAELILRHADRLSATLQQPDLSSVEGYEIAMLVVKTLETLRSEKDFDLFWMKVEHVRADLDVDVASLPRRRKRPRKYEDGLAEAEFHSDAKAKYRQDYFEALDLAITSIKTRFMQPGYKIFSQIEQLLLKSCDGSNHDLELETVCGFFVDDFNQAGLAAELRTLRELFSQRASGCAKATVNALKDVLTSLSPSQSLLIANVWRLFQLLLVLPATNATSERSFSALRRIKSYLRSTMAQSRLNHLMILHYHRDRTAQLSISAVGNEYILRNSTRQSTFATFV